jgi:cytosine permease
MVTGFPSVLIGFDWYKSGITLPQVLQCILLSFVILLAYSVPAAHLGSRTGQTYGLLSRSAFGKWGSWLVSINLVWVATSWYGLSAIYLAEGLKGLYQWQIPTAVVAGVLALVMAFNNFFGFTGIANFARYLAAPILIAWVGYTFLKASFSCPSAVLSVHPHVSFGSALTSVSAFIVGFSVWGNEADYWRYGKPRMMNSVIPLVVTLFVGQLVFPVTGWMLACMTGITDYASATALMNQYAFGGVTLIAAIVLAVTYFAMNDSSLYGAINALENVRDLPRRKVVSLLTLGGVLVAVGLADNSKGFEIVAALSSIVLPCATVVMMAEWFIVSRVLNVGADYTRVLSINELPPLRLPALVALVVGCLIGVATSGIIPGTDAWRVGVCSLQGWLTTLVVYLPLRLLEHRRQVARQRQFLEKLTQLGNEASMASPSVKRGPQ